MEKDKDALSPDAQIRQKVLYRLQHESAIDSSKIEVEVENATVILKGKTDTVKEKDLSELIARDTPGVAGVENHLHIEAGIAHALSNLAAHIQGDIIKDTDKE